MNASVTMRQAGQSKKMAEERLSFEEGKIILKWYLKFENVVEVRQWRRQYATEPPTRLTIARNGKRGHFGQRCASSISP